MKPHDDAPDPAELERETESLLAAKSDGDDRNAQGTAHWLGWRLFDLFSLLVRLLAGEPRPAAPTMPAPPAYYQFLPGVKTPGGRTENYISMGWVGAYVWHSLWGTPSLAAYWRARVLELYQRQRREGHMRGEQSAPDPHHGMHLAAALVCRLAARYLGHADVLAATGTWTTDHYAIGDACSDASGEVRAPGMRNKFMPPTQELWSYFVRAVKHLPQRIPRQKVERDGPYYLGARCCDALQRLGDVHLGVDTDDHGTVVVYPLTVARTPRGYLARIDRNDKARPLEPVDWILVDGERVEYGQDWKDPLPPIAGLEQSTFFRRAPAI